MQSGTDATNGRMVSSQQRVVTNGASSQPLFTSVHSQAPTQGRRLPAHALTNQRANRTANRVRGHDLTLHNCPQDASATP